MSKLTQLVSAPANVITFFREARDELKKVSWPSRETAVRYTLLVIISSLVLGLITGGIDYLLALGIEYLI